MRNRPRCLVDVGDWKPGDGVGLYVNAQGTGWLEWLIPGSGMAEWMGVSVYKVKEMEREFTERPKVKTPSLRPPAKGTQAACSPYHQI